MGRCLVILGELGTDFPLEPLGVCCVGARTQLIQFVHTDYVAHLHYWHICIIGAFALWGSALLSLDALNKSTH